MDNEKLEQRIRDLAEHAAPDKLGDILALCEQDARKGTIIDMNTEVKKKRNRFVPIIAAAAAVALICAAGFIGYGFGRNTAPTEDSVIMLDVNPSVSISVDADEKVLSVTPLNADGSIVIGDMDFTGSSLDVTVNALIGSMLLNGYIDDITNSILVTVENGDAARAATLQERVTALVSGALSSDGLQASVISQTVSHNDELSALAQQYGISEGKAELIRKVVLLDPTLTFETLAGLSVNDISLIAASRSLTDSSVTQTGSASDKGYIGEEAAKAAAYAHAGVSAADVSYSYVDYDSENGIMVYEVKFLAGDVEYEYDISALDGAIVKYERDQSGSGLSSPSASSDYIGEAAAKAAALEHAGLSESDVTWTKASFDRENGIMIYEIDFITADAEYDYEVNALTGAIVKSEREVRRTSAGSQGAVAPPVQTGAVSMDDYIGEEAARAAVLEHAGVASADATWTKCALERENGVMVYELDFFTAEAKYDYEVNATSGEIVKSEREVRGSGAAQAGAGTTDSYIGVDAAKAAVLEHAGVAAADATWIKTEQDWEHGVMVYDLDFITADAEYDYEVNASTGAILKSEREARPAASQGGAQTGGAAAGGTTAGGYIGEAAAKAAALGHAGVAEGDTYQMKVELDRDDGVYLYEVEFKAGGMEYEYEIDAYSGAVLKAERDYDD